ncbi:hypothetical protein JCM11251_002772 [Rhodosporidiobolus azoricus]
MRATQALRTTLRQATRTPRIAPPPSAVFTSSRPAFAIPPSRPTPWGTPSPSRSFSASIVRSQNPPKYSIGDLTDREYHDISDVTMDRLTEYLEETLEELDVEGSDVEYSTSICGKSGVLTVKLGDKGTYVVNKQPPNKQIWLSSPVSGPFRFDYSPSNRTWFYARDNETTMHELLTRELRQLTGEEGIEVKLDLEE